MTREQAIEIVKSQYSHDHVMKTALGLLIPELRESEDEKIRKALVWHLKAGEDFVSNGVTKAECIAYLEKQKYDRMKPIYDARESFESALEKAWNDYHNGYENVDKLEDDYVECAHAKGFREGYLFGLEKQKEQKPSIFPPGLGEVHWNPIPSGKDVQKWELPEDFEEAVYKVANFISPFNSQEELRKVSHRFAEQLLDIAKKDLQKPAWSEEDEKMIDTIVSVLGQYIDYKAVSGTGSGYATPRYSKEIAWLKPLRHQHKK